MEIRFIDGCTAKVVEVDGVEYDNSDKERDTAIRKALAGFVTTQYDIIPLLAFIAEHYGYAEDPVKCQQCGEWIEEYQIDI